MKNKSNTPKILLSEDILLEQANYDTPSETVTINGQNFYVRADIR